MNEIKIKKLIIIIKKENKINKLIYKKKLICIQQIELN